MPNFHHQHYISKLFLILIRHEYCVLIHFKLRATCIENKWASIDVIYYEYGALVLLFDNNERASRAFSILQDATFDNKQLLVLLLPNIQVFTAVRPAYNIHSR